MNTIEAMKQALAALSNLPLHALEAHQINGHLAACLDLKDTIASEEAQSMEPVMYGIQFGTGAFASYAYPSKEDAEKLSSWSHQPNKVVPLFTHPVPAKKEKAQSAEPVFYWNGFRKTDVREGSSPSFSEEENTWHDIPLFTHSAPNDGNWYKASDIDAMVRDIDIALNGEDAAPQALLCDLLPSLIARLAAPAPTDERAALIADATLSTTSQGTFDCPICGVSKPHSHTTGCRRTHEEFREHGAVFEAVVDSRIQSGAIRGKSKCGLPAQLWAEREAWGANGQQRYVLDWMQELWDLYLAGVLSPRAVLAADARVPMTWGKIEEIARSTSNHLEFARLVEIHHGIKP